MTTFVMLFTLSLVLLGCLLLIGFLSWMWMHFLRKLTQDQSNLVLTLQQEKREVLNRLMSRDLPTFGAMTAMTQENSTSSGTGWTGSEYIPQDDQTEAERLVALGGFGQALFEEDAASFNEDLAGLGLYVNTDD